MLGQQQWYRSDFRKAFTVSSAGMLPASCSIRHQDGKLWPQECWAANACTMLTRSSLSDGMDCHVFRSAIVLLPITLGTSSIDRSRGLSIPPQEGWHLWGGDPLITVPRGMPSATWNREWWHSCFVGPGPRFIEVWMDRSYCLFTGFSSYSTPSSGLRFPGASPSSLCMSVSC